VYLIIVEGFANVRSYLKMSRVYCLTTLFNRPSRVEFIFLVLFCELNLEKVFHVTGWRPEKPILVAL
jgi:hypothetical protein